MLLTPASYRTSAKDISILAADSFSDFFIAYNGAPGSGYPGVGGFFIPLTLAVNVTNETGLVANEHVGLSFYSFIGGYVAGTIDGVGGSTQSFVDSASMPYWIVITDQSHGEGDDTTYGATYFKWATSFNLQQGYHRVWSPAEQACYNFNITPSAQYYTGTVADDANGFFLRLGAVSTDIQITFDVTFAIINWFD